MLMNVDEIIPLVISTTSEHVGAFIADATGLVQNAPKK
jgi:hypothetical protein